MQIKKLKLKLKEENKTPRKANFKYNALNENTDKLLAKSTNVYQNIISADSFSISEEIERDFRRYSNMQEATL